MCPPLLSQSGKRRHPYPLSVMVRIRGLQLFYNLSDPDMEDLLYESESLLRFVGLKRSGPLSDETNMLNSRHLLERQGLGYLEEINAHPESQWIRLREGTIVDAAII